MMSSMLLERFISYYSVLQEGPQCMILCVTHSPLENGPFIQQVHPNKRQDPAANQLQGFRIPVDHGCISLYALPDTYLHFPAGLYGYTTQGFRLQKERTERSKFIVFEAEHRNTKMLKIEYEKRKHSSDGANFIVNIY